MRPLLRALALSPLLAMACAPAAPDAAAVRESLLAADRAFAAATAERGLEGWMSAFDTTGIQMEADRLFTPGLAAVRATMAPAFADTAWHLTWEPTMAFASAAGDLGYTLGTWRSSRAGPVGVAEEHTGKYVTIWRRQADGGWKVVFDGGNPDTAPPGAAVGATP